MGSTTTSKRWLITGASSGLGLAMTLAALNAGHKVVAGARDPEKAAETYPEVEKLGGKWLKLDVTKTDTAETVAKASEAEGGFDVVVNNAGFLQSGTIEDLE
jgi:NAD(P)-dependent dehydrogenase (short-subunit alcohol dehydrogenase family)